MAPLIAVPTWLWAKSSWSFPVLVLIRLTEALLAFAAVKDVDTSTVRCSSDTNAVPLSPLAKTTVGIAAAGAGAVCVVVTLAVLLAAFGSGSSCLTGRAGGKRLRGRNVRDDVDVRHQGVR